MGAATKIIGMENLTTLETIGVCVLGVLAWFAGLWLYFKIYPPRRRKW